MLVQRPWNYRLSDAVSTHVAPRNAGASVSGVNVAHEASETLSSSFTLRYHAWMLANALSQRAAWVLVPRPLNCRVNDAASAHIARRNGGASPLIADGVPGACEPTSSHAVMSEHAQMPANAVKQSSVCVLALQTLI